MGTKNERLVDMREVKEMNGKRERKNKLGQVKAGIDYAVVGRRR